jgi:hypothetical protein
VAAAHQDLSWQQQLRGVWQQCEAALGAQGGSTDRAPAAAQRAAVEALPPLQEVPGGSELAGWMEPMLLASLSCYRRRGKPGLLNA